MAILRHLIEFMINPYFLCLLVLGLCIFFLWRRTYLVFVRIMLCLVFIFLMVISTGWLPRYITSKLETQYPIVQQIDPKIKWVVVLSGGQNQLEGMPANVRLSSASIKRLVEGVRIFRALPQAKLVLSGGGTSGEQPEALLLAQLAKWFSIPEQDVVLELKSINTADQARELVSIVHKQPFYLVTSAIHMPRSIALCQQQGLHPIAAPTDYTFFWSTEDKGKMIIPNTYNLSYFSIAMHEILGRIWATLTQKI
ncbi:YdcF family protein [Legionella maioricensis]|uniref:YdcF family protein n=1 Tax=Legionella maioricensis TaxID=2896528 RepID=A0A9X2IBH8_9GAMM|nr:ElyC/SanA/YdcF family protein [Legionella maioricensis]MCL9683407.1 YdcF family protein [Legionella maioricensis]MCL9685897.1 YdcF family protein [Legionella maioricensis]